MFLSKFKMPPVLFGTSGCHLCEQAEQIIRANFQQIQFDVIDIAEHSQWQDKYAVKIPVLYHAESGTELCWPFSESDVHEFINAANLS